MLGLLVILPCLPVTMSAYDLCVCSSVSASPLARMFPTLHEHHVCTNRSMLSLPLCSYDTPSARPLDFSTSILPFSHFNFPLFFFFFWLAF